jgi:hypothetical protein
VTLRRIRYRTIASVGPPSPQRERRLGVRGNPA